MRANILMTALFLSTTASLASETSSIQLMPAVSEIQAGQTAPIGGKGLVLLSGQASPAERHAAQLLVRQVKRRFGREWAVSTEMSSADDTGIRVLLGRSGTFPAMDRIAAEAKVSVPEQMDGYAVNVAVRDGAVTAVVAGENERGVIYGQDTLFQLLARSDDTLTIRCAAIRDWPAIPLRGRPHPHYEYFLKPENFDCTLLSRLNFIDLRNSIYAFEAGAKFNREEIGKVITEARKRALIIFAVVNCGVPAKEQDAVLATFKEFLDLGADALWLSFDDKGPGEAPREMVSRVLALGRERGITGNRIAITPPKGSYQVIITDFNRQIMAIPGMEEAAWYWTSIPCAQDVADTRAIGLKTLPSWWHNWPRFREGSLAAVPGRAYSPIISMAEGWNHPTDRELTEAGRHVHAVLPWDGTQSQQNYLLPVIGWWSWRPERHDFAAVRARIYDIVFGPQQREAAFAFDDAFEAARRRLRFTVSHTEYTPMCPPRLRSPGDRPGIIAEIEKMKHYLSMLAGADSASLLDAELLRREYLEPMAGQVRGGTAAATAPYPEYWWDPHQERVLNAVYDQDPAGADRLIASVRDRLLQEITEVERLLGTGTTNPYSAWWRKRAEMTAADWTKITAARKTRLNERVADYSKTVAPFDSMLRNLKDPPVQVGTGAWKRHNHVLATVLPEEREQFWGDWIGGICEKNGLRVACFAVDRHTMINEGGFSELPINVPLSGRRDRLALVIYLADANKESFGFGYAKWRWAGSRAIRLLWNHQELWKADLGIPRLSGEWFVVPLPAMPEALKTLPLRLRVEDYESAKNNLEIVYVGPIRLLELDRD